MSQKNAKETVSGQPVLSTAPVPHLETTGAVVNYRDSWRIFRIVTEIVEGYQFLSELQKEVIVLGSARLAPNNKYYKIALEFGRLLGKNGFSTVTGGGPGIMEAANKGAHESGGESVGLNIQLPFEQRINPYVKKSIGFYYFFTRKVMLTSPGNAFVFFPGGFGTLDEFFEVVDYMELGFMDKAPIIMVGSEFWKPVMDFVRKKSIKEAGSLSETDLSHFHIVDSAADAYDLMKDVQDKPNVCNTDPNNPLCLEGTLEWKVFRIMAELVDGFEFLTQVQNGVTVLGTKSMKTVSPYYEAAHQLGAYLAERKFAVVTGGGPGIMEAANRGAFERGGQSVGINTRKGGKERTNAYVTKSTGFVFPFVRKLIISSPSQGFVFFPGGFGTLHQLFELLTLIETKKMEPVPIILYGREFWQPLVDFMHELHATFSTISHMDEGIVTVAETPEEVMANFP